uniref:Uncharacterized protein n=1 Tax=Phlebia radiata TaxID=5308 RepID=L8B9G9_PHLRA|nr:hypothetical protein Pra_mt0311 [Phlebia radiata]CCF07379.1 hypothetical protein Pra_mt0311 [Phlebia radiata]
MYSRNLKKKNKSLPLASLLFYLRIAFFSFYPLPWLRLRQGLNKLKAAPPAARLGLGQNRQAGACGSPSWLLSKHPLEPAAIKLD